MYSSANSSGLGGIDQFTKPNGALAGPRFFEEIVVLALGTQAKPGVHYSRILL